jgi:filamentous hemagglutinin family protein
VAAQEAPETVSVLPEAPTVVHGDVTITPNGPDLTVRQSTPFGIVNWNSFSIGAGQGVHFDNGRGATLNRVTGDAISRIDGTLSATGSVYLLNRNGVIIGENGRVLTGGDFLVATRDIADADFLNGGGFALVGDSRGGVTNLGQISSLGGNVLLAGYTVENKGSIDAATGRVGLVAGQHIDVLTDVSWMGGAYAVSLGERGNDVTTSGRLQSLIAELRTHNGNIYALAGNNAGLIQATGVRNEGGQIILTAENGTVQSTGTLVATRDGDGGDISITGATIENYGGTQDVSGATGGTLRLKADSVVTDTAMLARGTSGAGGTIAIDASREILFTSGGRVDASGVTRGGEVALAAGPGVTVVSGRIDATATEGAGGDIDLLGRNVSLLGATVDASGATGGGTIHVGGGYQGATVRDQANAASTYISDRTTLAADTTGTAGNGGTVVAWADGGTQFAGTITARGGTASGNGGTVETSGLESLGVSGTVNASARAASGTNGQWLLDPRNITIGSTPVAALNEFQRIVQNFGAAPDSLTANTEFGTYLDVSGETAVIGVPSLNFVYVYESGQFAARLSPPTTGAFANGTTGPTGITSAAEFGRGVGVQRDLIAIMAPGQSSGSGFTGVAHIFARANGWANGSGNSVMFATRNRAYTSAPTSTQFGRSSAAGNVRTFDFGTGRDDFRALLAIGDPSTGDPVFGPTTNVGTVAFLEVGYGQSSRDMPFETTFSLVQPSNVGVSGIGFGSSVAVDRGNIYITYSASGSRANDLTVRATDGSTGVSGVSFANYFANNPGALAVSDGRLFVHNATASRIDYGEFAVNTSNQFAISSARTALNLGLGGLASAITSLSASGDTLLVGNGQLNSNNGLVQFYTRPSGGWVTGSTVLAPSLSLSSTTGAGFGLSTAIDGNVALIGSPFAASGAIARRGEATLYRRSAGVWSATDAIRPAVTSTNSSFGNDIDADGANYVIGDSSFGDPNSTTSNLGRVYVYENGQLAATLAGGFGTRFGASVSISGNRVATASLDTANSSSRLFLFDRGTAWRNGSANLASSFNESSLIQSVALDGTTLAFGSPTAGPNSLGKVGVFTNIGSGLASPVTLRNPNGVAGTADNFGFALALSGNTLATNRSARPFNSGPGQPDATSNYDVYVFENLANNWATATATRLAGGTILGTDDSNGFGYSLGLDNNTLAVGYQRDGRNGVARGVYVFERTTTWAAAATPVARLTTPAVNEPNFGFDVDVRGDLIAISSTNWFDDTIRTFGGSFPASFSPVYIYQRGGGWRSGNTNVIATLLPATNIDQRPFGADIALLEGGLLAGSVYRDLTTNVVRPVYRFNGPFDLTGRSSFTATPGSDLAINAGSLANSLSLGTNVTLQANNDITVSQNITVNNTAGNGGSLTLQAGRSIIFNASITTDNGNLTLLAGDPRANATFRDTGERVVVLGRNSTNAGITLDLGTGNLIINAADRFENRTGSTNPIRFASVNPGRFLIYSRTPDQTGAPDLANLTADLATIGRSWVAYNRTIDLANLAPSSLPAGSGFLYSVQPSVQVGVGNATITYGQAATANLTLTGLTLGGNTISGTVFGISASDLPNLVTTGFASHVPLSAGGFAHAGTYAGGVTAAARTNVTSGAVYGVAVSTGSAGNLTVNKATLTVRPNDVTRTYGDANPTFTATFTGFATGDSVSDLDTAPVIGTDAVARSAVGNYTITATGGLDNNYLFSVPTPGRLTITTRDLLLTGLTGGTRVYDPNSFAAPLVGTATVAPLSGDVVTVSTAGLRGGNFRFNDRDAGVDKPIDLFGFTLTGAQAANYRLVLPTDLVGTVTRATLYLSRDPALLGFADRVYDATTNITPTGLGIGYAETSPGRGFDLGLVTATFADANVGTNKPITITGITLTSNLAVNYVLNTEGFTASILPRPIDVTGITALDRTYDGTNLASLSGTATVTGLGSDLLSLTGTASATFADANAGTAKPITVTGLTLAGTAAANYTLRFPTNLFATVTPANLLLSGLTAVNRVYDGTRTAALTGTATVTPLGSDQVTLTGAATATFADKAASATPKPVTLSLTGLSLAGTAAANYTLVAPTSLTALISPRPVSVSGLTAVSRVYDATTTAIVSGTPLFGGILSGDDATISTSTLAFSFADKNVGTAKPITVSGLAITGADANNYDLGRVEGLVASITPATLNVTGVTALDRAYNATTAVALSGGTLTGVLSTDAVSLVTSGAAGTLADRSAATAPRAVTASGYTLSGADRNNYVLVQPTGLTATISRFALNLTGLSFDKTYDGTTTAPISFTGLDRLFAGDVVTVDTSAVSASYADKSASAVARAVTLTGLFGLSGADAANYSLTQPAGPFTGTVARRGITVTGLTIANKTYDGTVTAAIAGTGSFGGAIAGDDLAINVGAINVTFADANAGVNKSVALSGVTLAGADANNYTATTPTGLTATILPKDLTVTGLAAVSRVYDRTTTAGVTGTGLLSGVIAGESITLNESARTGAFADKNVGTAKPVTVSGLSLVGSGTSLASNYRLVAPTLTAAITRADATIRGLTAANRVYDATTVASVTGTAILDFGALNNVFASAENVSLTGSATGAFATKDVGTAKPVIVGGLSLGGTDAANYNLVLPTGLTANVTPAPLTVTGARVVDKVYDATRTASLTAFGIVTPFGTDRVVLENAATTATFATKDVGTAKSVTVTGYTLSGVDAANYTVVAPTGLTANVTRAPLTLTGLSVADRFYDRSASASVLGTATVTPLGTDAVRVVGTPVGLFPNKNAGQNLPVRLSGLSLAGTDAGNYDFIVSNLSATIVPLPISVTGLTATSRVYDGTRTAAVSTANAFINHLGGDIVTLGSTGVTATFADKNVGTAKPVTVTGLTLGGIDGANYTVVAPTGLTANITPRAVTVTGADAVNRAYDRTTTVALTGGALSGAVAGDAVSLVTTAAVGTIPTKDAGDSRPVTATGYTISGGDASNYTLSQPTGIDVIISRVALTIAGLQVADKVFDGTVFGTLSGGTLNGGLTGDDLALVTTAALARFDSPAAGLDKAVTASGFTLSGADAANYLLPTLVQLRGNILSVLRTISDVIPPDVLRATAAVAATQQRAALAAAAVAQPDAVTVTDVTSRATQLATGIPVVTALPSAVREIASSNPTVAELVRVTDNARAAAERATASAEAYRSAATELKQLGQQANTVERTLQVERGLRATYVAAVSSAEAELAKADANLATIAEARRRIDTLTRQAAEATRLGRGSEVAQYERLLADARTIVATEGSAIERRAALASVVNQARSTLAASEEKVAQLTAEKAKLADDLARTESTVQRLQSETVEARNAAFAASRVVESTRAAAATATREQAAAAEAELARLKSSPPPPPLPAGTNAPLSPERVAELNAAQQQATNLLRESIDLDRSRVTALQAVAASEQKVGPLDLNFRTDSRLVDASRLSPDRIAALDMSKLGLSDTAVLPDRDISVVVLNTTAQDLDRQLRNVPMLVDASGNSVPMSAPINRAANSPRGLQDIDTPVTFAPAVETALKDSLIRAGALVDFSSNPTLNALPVASQLRLQNALRDYVAQQVDMGNPAIDNVHNAAGAIAAKAIIEAAGLGDVPGLEGSLGGSISTLTQGLSKVGDARNPEEGLKQVGAALAAAGKEFFEGLTTSQSKTEREAQARDDAKAVEERRRDMFNLAQRLIAVEDSRVQAVAARDRNLELAKDHLVTLSKAAAATQAVEVARARADAASAAIPALESAAQARQNAEVNQARIAARDSYAADLAAAEARRATLAAQAAAVAAIPPAAPTPPRG